MILFLWTISISAWIPHIQSDITEIKGDIRRLDSKTDAVKDSLAAFRVEMKDALAALRSEMQSGLAAVRGEIQGGLAALRGEMKDDLAGLKVGRMIDRVWWLLISAGLLAVIARAFKWL